MKVYTFEQIKDKHIGLENTEKRKAWDKFTKSSRYGTDVEYPFYNEVKKEWEWKK